jgi:hypothetical protein
MLWYDQGEDSDADADDTIKPPWSDGEIVKIAFGARVIAFQNRARSLTR